MRVAGDAKKERINAFHLKSIVGRPIGANIEIPLNTDEAETSFGLHNITALRDHYDHKGYVIVRRAIPPLLCDGVRRAFGLEVKPYPGFLYRQASASPEKHVFSAHGYMLNSLLNIQDLPKSYFAEFRQNSLAVLTHVTVQHVVKALLGEDGILVQSMFFEGNAQTWAHQDTYYLDSAEAGRMTAVWVALEDIMPGAGRFYVCPGSQNLELPRNGHAFGIAFHHQSYKDCVIELIRSRRLMRHAPALAKGDALFWSSKTIHGSLKTTQPEYSRCSLTAHYIPKSSPLMQFQARKRSLKLVEVNSVSIHCPKDQSKVLNRLALYVEAACPTLFQFFKKLLITVAMKRDDPGQ